MKKWYKQLLSGGGGSSADAYEETYDPDPGNDMIDIKVGGNTYSFPKSLFDNVGKKDGKNNPEKGYVAAVYAAYYAANGKDPYDVAKEEYGTVEINGRTRDATSGELNKYIMDTILKNWMEEQGETFTAPEGYNYTNLNELHADNKSFQKGIDTAYSTNAVKVNGQGYQDWSQTLPRNQEGYSEDYGLPVGRDGAGNWMYDAGGNVYVTASGAEILDFEGATDNNETPVVLDPEGNGLVNSETGEAIVAAPSVTKPAVQPLEDAYNKYYEDIFSQREGTLGKQILDNNTSLYEKEAANAQVLANTGVQAQAMAQAQGIKQTVDAVRSERLAQLRGGMSESQLADRELSMLMGSTNQFTNQGQMANQEAMAAQLAKSTARETAFNDYIAQGTALGQNAAANYASQAGDIMSQAMAYQARMRAENKTIGIDDAIAYVSNPNT